MWFPYSHTTLQHQMRKKKKDSWLACSGNARRNALLWLLYLHACLLKQEVPKLFQSVIPLSITGVTRRPDAGVLSSRRSRQGYGSPLKETSGWGCDHSLCWKTLPSSVFMTKYYWFQSILVIVHCLLKFPGSFNWGKLILYFLSWTMYNYNHMLM